MKKAQNIILIEIYPQQYNKSSLTKIHKLNRYNASHKIWKTSPLV